MLKYDRFAFGEARPEALNKIFRLRYEVYALEFGFENPDDFPDKLEKDIYDPHSTHFIAINEDEDIVGTVRMILNSEKGFPIEHASEITGFKDKPAPENITEVSRLAVAKILRRRPEDGLYGVESYLPKSQGGVADKENYQNDQRKRPAIVLGLYRAIYHKCKELGITHMYMITEDKLFHALYKFGFVFSKVGEPVEYHGKRTPYATSWRTIEEHMREHQNGLLEFLLSGLDEKYHPRF